MGFPAGLLSPSCCPKMILDALERYDSRSLPIGAYPTPGRSGRAVVGVQVTGEVSFFTLAQTTVIVEVLILKGG